MKTIELRHNPFKAETVITVDGREIHLNCIGTGEGSHIQEWKDSVFPQIIKKINIGPGSPCAVVFFGVEEDYSVLKQSWESYCMGNKDVKIYFEYGTKPPVTLASKEIEIHELTSKYMKETPCDILKSAGVSSKIENIKGMNLPEYLEKAEKLYRQTNEYIKLVESLHLRDEAEQQLTGKNAELDELNADMEERRRLEAENAGVHFKEAATKLENDVKKEVGCFFDGILSETNTEIDALQSEIAENKRVVPENELECIYGGVLECIIDPDKEVIDEQEIKKTLNTLLNEKLDKIIEMPLEIYKNASSSLMSSIDKPVIGSFDRKNIVGYVTKNNDDTGLTGRTNAEEVVLPLLAGIKTAALAKYLSFVVENNEDLKQKLTPVFDSAKKYFAEVSEKVKMYYLLEIDNVIDILKKKGHEEKEKQKKVLELIRDANDEAKNKLEAEITAIQSRLNWIDDFEKKLNGIFEL
jgi:hypothetical protein